MSFDHLNLGKDDKVRKILQEQSDTIYDEIILYSSRVTKINRKAKSQQRILVISDKAIYNFTPLSTKKRSFSIRNIRSHRKSNSNIQQSSSSSSTDSVGQLKRRISITDISMISVSAIVHEVVLHVPNEYDYLYRCSAKRDVEQIVRTLQTSATSMGHHIQSWCFELNNLTEISENAKTKGSHSESTQQYAERKVCEWRNQYVIKPYEPRGRSSLKNNKNRVTKPKHAKSHSAMIFEGGPPPPLGSPVGSASVNPMHFRGGNQNRNHQNNHLNSNNYRISGHQQSASMQFQNPNHQNTHQNQNQLHSNHFRGGHQQSSSMQFSANPQYQMQMQMQMFQAMNGMNLGNMNTLNSAPPMGQIQNDFVPPPLLHARSMGHIPLSNTMFGTRPDNTFQVPKPQKTDSASSFYSVSGDEDDSKESTPNAMPTPLGPYHMQRVKSMPPNMGLGTDQMQNMRQNGSNTGNMGLNALQLATSNTRLTPTVSPTQNNTSPSPFAFNAMDKPLPNAHNMSMQYSPLNDNRNGSVMSNRSVQSNTSFYSQSLSLNPGHSTPQYSTPQKRFSNQSNRSNSSRGSNISVDLNPNRNSNSQNRRPRTQDGGYTANTGHQVWRSSGLPSHFNVNKVVHVGDQNGVVHVHKSTLSPTDEEHQKQRTFGTDTSDVETTTPDTECVEENVSIVHSIAAAQKLTVGNKEDYLSDQLFWKTFNMTKADFKALRPWKQRQLKKGAGIF